MIKTFRGLLADGGQDRIRLQTIKGKVGYRIAKLECFPASPGTLEYEGVTKVFTESQSSIVGTANFTDSNLLGIAYYAALTSKAHSPLITIFDNVVFNQDIYISYKANTGSASMNYYLELEVIPLDDAGAEYTTVKDLRTRGF